MSLAIILESLCLSLGTVRILAIFRQVTRGGFLREFHLTYLEIPNKILKFSNLEKYTH
jgi:hypothetical protein